MLYLTLMASLALGFYSASNTAVLVSDNEQKVERARLAAESGLDFARFNLSKVLIPAKALITQHFSILGDQMSVRLNGSGNIDNGSIYVDANTIRVPADPNKFIKSDEKGAEFQFTITDIGNRQVRVISVGRNNLTASAAGFRTVRMDFELQQKPSSIFQYGIATRGTVSTSGSTSLLGQPNPDKGSILSVSTTDPTPIKIGGKEVSGDISVVNPDANVVVTGGSVGGTTNPTDIQTNHVHKGVDDAEFPTLDTSMFIPYATNTYTPGKSTYSNIVIPPNTNPSFSAGTSLKGVIYVKTPNRVSFAGNTSIQGVLVTDTTGQVGNLNTNTVTFQGGFESKGVETLDPSYGDLRNLSGSFMIMPGFSLSFAGNFNATAYGTIVVDKASMTGSAVVTLHGSLIIMSNTPMTMQGNAQLTAGENAMAFPAGLRFSNYYVAIPSTYDEVKKPNP
ncbi:MAG TPA: hypothetical protein VGP94_01000 [Tepidisphaeraceae bacterium]|jgi:hypothetical protein|nr:hypothetical protein [Tepidisphaeraceae bacterium]